MLYGKFTDKGNIPVNNPNMHNVEESNGLSKMSGLQPLTTGSVLKILFPLGSVIVFYIPEITSEKSIQAINV